MPVIGANNILRGQHILQNSPLDSDIAALNPVLWFKLNENNGSSVYNSGSAPITASLLGNVLQNAAGVLRSNDAYDFGGTTGKINIPYHTDWANVTTFEWAFVVKFNSATPTQQRLFGGSAESVYIEWRPNTGSNIRAHLGNTASTQFFSNSSTTIAVGAYHLISVTYDNTGDRKAHIYIDGTEVSYLIQTALTGTYQVFTSDHTFGNNNAASVGVNGLIDSVLLFNYVLNSTQRTLIKTDLGL